MPKHKPEMSDSEWMAERNKQLHGKGPLESVRIEIAENGFVVNCQYRPKNEKPGMPMKYTPEKQKVFKHTEDLLGFLKVALGKGNKEEGEEY